MADRRSRRGNSHENGNRVDPDADETISGHSSTDMPGRYNTLHRDPEPEPRPRRTQPRTTNWRQSWIEPQSKHPPTGGVGRQPFEYSQQHANAYRDHYRPVVEPQPQPQPQPQYQIYPNYEYQQPPYPNTYAPYQGQRMPHAPMPPTNNNFPPNGWGYAGPYQGPPNGNHPFQPAFPQQGGVQHNPNVPSYGRGRDGHYRGQGEPSNWGTVSNTPSRRSSSSMEQKLAKMEREMKKVKREKHDAKIREEVRADAARQVDAEIMRIRRELSIRGDSNQSEAGFDMMRVPRAGQQLVNNRQVIRAGEKRLPREVWDEFGDFLGYLS